MIDHISFLVYSVVILFLGTKVLTFFMSLFQGRRFGESSPLPSVTIYIQRDSLIFWLLSPWLAPFIERLPFGCGHWVRYLKRDFAWHTKGNLHRQELGSDVFWVVGAGGAHLYVSDADVISQVVHRWKDFSKLVKYYRSLNIFGPNVLTAEGAVWQRHRKIIAPPFSERNSRFVVLLFL